MLAAASAAISLVWIAWVADLKGLYLDVFRAALREGTLRPAVDLPAVDLVSLETLFGALNSADDHEVLAAMDLLAEEGRARLIPALILYHPSQRVVLRALELFARGQPGRLPPRGRRGRRAMRTPRSARPPCVPRTRVRPTRPSCEAGRWTSALVRATALAGLVSGGGGDERVRTRRAGRRWRDGSRWRARSSRSLASVRGHVARLVEGPVGRGAGEAAFAMGELRSPRFLPALLPLLGQRDVRRGGAALVGCGEEGLAFLDQALGDQAYPHEVRRHLPRTISLFPPAAAAVVLQRHLVSETDGMVRFRSWRGLNRLAAHPEVELDGTILRQATEATLEAAFRLVHWRVVLERGLSSPAPRYPGPRPARPPAARQRGTRGGASLPPPCPPASRRGPREIYRGLRNPSAKVKAGGRELLENLVRPPPRHPLIALIDDAPDLERLALAVSLLTRRALSTTRSSWA